MHILYVGNGNYNHRGSRYYDVGRKIMNGLIRNGHNLYFLSDRDESRSANIFRSSKLGIKHCNRVFLDICSNFGPDLIVLGHADIISADSLVRARSLLPKVKIAQFNVDPIFRPHNISMIRNKLPYVDATFITTAGEALKIFHNPQGFISFIPNPVDSSIEWPRCHERNDQPYDIFYGIRHSTWDPRIQYPLYLEQFQEIAISFHGKDGKPDLFGRDYYKEIFKSKMGLNLSTKRLAPKEKIAIENSKDYKWKKYINEDAAPEALYLYSSDRISQYMGSGLLTISMRGHSLEEMFTEDKEMVYFSTKEELLEKVLYFKHNDKQRMEIALQGWKKYHSLFNEKLIAKYIVETTCNLPLTEDYAWPTEKF
jgi:hypothetical protein